MIFDIPNKQVVSYRPVFNTPNPSERYLYNSFPHSSSLIPPHCISSFTINSTPENNGLKNNSIPTQKIPPLTNLIPITHTHPIHIPIPPRSSPLISNSNTRIYINIDKPPIPNRRPTSLTLAIITTTNEEETSRGFFKPMICCLFDARGEGCEFTFPAICCWDLVWGCCGRCEGKGMFCVRIVH